MSAPTLREELDAITNDLVPFGYEWQLAQGPAGTRSAVRVAVGRLRALAARCDEKPAEPAPLPEVLGKSKAALGQAQKYVAAQIAPLPHHPSATLPATLDAALSAIKAYAPQPLPEAVQEVERELRRRATELSHTPASTIDAVLTTLADRLASAVPEKRGALPEAIRAVVAEMRAHADAPEAHAAFTKPWAEIWALVRSWAARLESAAVHAAPDEGECARELLSDLVSRRADLLATYGGGYRGDLQKLTIFHHGIETVFNWLEGLRDKGRDQAAPWKPWPPVPPAHPEAKEPQLWERMRDAYVASPLPKERAAPPAPAPSREAVAQAAVGAVVGPCVVKHSEAWWLRKAEAEHGGTVGAGAPAPSAAGEAEPPLWEHMHNALVPSPLAVPEIRRLIREEIAALSRDPAPEEHPAPDTSGTRRKP